MLCITGLCCCCAVAFITYVVFSCPSVTSPCLPHPLTPSAADCNPSALLAVYVIEPRAVYVIQPSNAVWEMSLSALCLMELIWPTCLQDIAADYPDYLDAYLRLACIERKQGNLKKAIDWAEKGIDRAEATSKGSASHTDLLALAGQLPWTCTPSLYPHTHVNSDWGMSCPTSPVMTLFLSTQDTN